jgi:hypothetical protein
MLLKRFTATPHPTTCAAAVFTNFFALSIFSVKMESSVW